MPIRPRFLKLVLLTCVALCLGGAASALASPRYVRPAPAPDGRYGKLQGQELIGFTVEDRRVSDFFFNILMQCHDSESGEDFVRAFTGHEIGGGRADRSGHWSREYVQTDGGREGSGRVEVNFTRGRGVFASVSVVTPGGPESFETCHGFIDLKMRRGPLS